MAIANNKTFEKFFKPLEREQNFKTMPIEIRNSLQRFCEYIYMYTDLEHIAFVNESHFGGYIKYHKLKGFIDRDFTKVISDLKNVIFFLNRSGVIKKRVSFDFSLRNTRFWREL